MRIYCRFLYYALDVEGIVRSPIWLLNREVLVMLWHEILTVWESSRPLHEKAATSRHKADIMPSMSVGCGLNIGLDHHVESEVAHLEKRRRLREGGASRS